MDPVYHSQNSSSSTLDALPSCQEEEVQIRNYAQQRIIFLNLLVFLRRKKVHFCLHGSTNISGRFESMDCRCKVFAVSNLETPIGIQPSALIRSNDAVSVSFTSVQDTEELSQ